MTDWLLLAARFLIALLFLGAAIVELSNTAQFTQEIGTRVSGVLIPLFLIGAIAVEVLAGTALLFGFQARLAAVILAVYTLVATSLYHTNFNQPLQGDLFAKDLAIAGGLLYVAVFGAGRISVDAFLGI